MAHGAHVIFFISVLDFQLVELLGSMVYNFNQFWKVSPIFLQIVSNLISFGNSNYLHISHLMLSQNAANPGFIPGSGRSPGEGIGYPLQYSWAFLVAQTVKYLPAVGETWIQSPGWEDPLEEGMAIHSGILAWRIPWTEEPGGLGKNWTQMSEKHFHFQR